MEIEIAKLLLEIKAVFLSPLEPFTWASGIKSPIYCDNRLILSSPAARRRVELALANSIRNAYPGAELLAGTSTAGIAHAALAADILNLPMAYVRGSAKEHGRRGQIEGRVNNGQNVVVIEDLISTAGSVTGVVAALRDAGANVLGIASIFTYEMEKGRERLAEFGVENVSLTSYTALIKAALEEGFIAPGDVKKLEAFKNAPEDPSWMTL